MCLFLHKLLKKRSWNLQHTLKEGQIRKELFESLKRWKATVYEHRIASDLVLKPRRQDTLHLNCDIQNNVSIPLQMPSIETQAEDIPHFPPIFDPPFRVCSGLR